MPPRTFRATEEKKSMPGFKTSKDKQTLLSKASAASDFKLNPKLIDHSQNSRPLRNYAKVFSACAL